MSWIGVVLVVIGVYLVVKLVGFFLKLAMVAVVIAGLYWVAAPVLGMPVPF